MEQGHCPRHVAFELEAGNDGVIDGASWRIIIESHLKSLQAMHSACGLLTGFCR
jgi:hypothetical protein